MNSEKVDAGDFIFSYPVYFLLNPSRPVTFVSSSLPAVGGFGIHVFTDEPAADDYLAKNPQPPGVIKHVVPNRETFAAKVAILAEDGAFTHLIVDARGGDKVPVRCIAISELLRHFDENS